MATEVGTLDHERIGNYRFVRMLHPGQSSSVFEVTQEGSGKRFVIKQLNKGEAEDPAARKASRVRSQAWDGPPPPQPHPCIRVP